MTASEMVWVAVIAAVWVAVCAAALIVLSANNIEDDE